ncbi:MAG: protein kinase [Planctomycetes bacterium]|nr:protein kinase [Planctomycetota bacterium]
MKAILPYRPTASLAIALDQVRQDMEDRLQELLANHLILMEDWEKLTPDIKKEVLSSLDVSGFFATLVEHGLLNTYQAGRIEAGTSFGLVLGNYRILERVGAGGMGVVFKAEHIRLRRQVAIKVMPVEQEHSATLLLRFYSEVRAIAQLVHPNIVAAIDAGEVAGPRPDDPVLHYFVMEYVPGQDLEEYVLQHGPLDPTLACDIVQQVAAALGEANKHNMVHRDIKPSNILITPEGQAKLLDFGLARSNMCRLTEPGTVLGTLDFMAPEQVKDASMVDIRADLYALGGTLYWCLTGRLPFPPQKNVAQDLARRLTQPPPSLLAARPDIPRELDAIVTRLMALDPEDRYPTPEAVQEALLPWVAGGLRAFQTARVSQCRDEPSYSPSGNRLSRSMLQRADMPYQILVVDDEPAPRQLCCCVLKAEGIVCDEAAGGLEALDMVYRKPYDLVLLDINMPDVSGLEVCRRLREQEPCPHLKLITLSGFANPDDMAQMLLAGADDFLAKPFSIVQLMARVKAALRLKEAQDRSDLLTCHLLTLNQELEKSLCARDSNLVDARNALVLALAKLVEHRDGVSSGRLGRLQRYTRTLAEEASHGDHFASQIDRKFVDLLACTAPLLDIGKVGLPDHILLKPGKLTSDERIIMQAHTVIGSDILTTVAEQHGSARAFLQMAIDVARHHHERYDGKGYPDHLAGDAIPLAARLVSPCDASSASVRV